MPCYHPQKAYRTPTGIVWSQLARHDIIGDITIPCKQCIGCRLDRAQEWSVRCLHEAKMHEQNSYITLTYNDENLPADRSLDYRHYQLFMKKLRKKAGEIKFFMCGEYGELTQRPHYHALLFGYQFPDLEYMGKNATGDKLYGSNMLAKLWGLGNVIVGEVSKQSAGYVARYALKKVTGDRAEAHYNGRTPEFAQMSRRPGIGATFFEKWAKDILPNDYVIVDGIKIPVPTYYDRIYKGDMDEIKWKREIFARKHNANNTDERLYAREEVQIRKAAMLLRNKIE
ncbi:MAG: replication initiator protein [Microvirus sp.]|nr:MAG: replication initiator protein [Microvirus sp.]